jgi:hypothetical protein
MVIIVAAGGFVERAAEQKVAVIPYWLLWIGGGVWRIRLDEVAAGNPSGAREEEMG